MKDQSQNQSRKPFFNHEYYFEAEKIKTNIDLAITVLLTPPLDFVFPVLLTLLFSKQQEQKDEKNAEPK